jgi:hypothetical protein
MKKHRGVLVGVVVLGSIVGCDDYATKAELEQLRGEYVATHDTMVALWEMTDSMASLIPSFDTVSPPRCIPRCLLIMPPAPRRTAP